MVKSKQVREINLYFSSLKFEPYSDLKGKHNTRSILKEVFSYLRDKRKNGQGHLIDRHEKRSKADSRELFMVSHRKISQEDRFRCSMALLRKGKQPKLKPTDKFKLLPIGDLGGDIVEETHFFIDFSTERCIICSEFNDRGPRTSDLIYYLRNVAGSSTLKIARSTENTKFFNSTLDETLSNLRNVLHMDVKFKPSSLAQMDSDVRKNYYSSMENIGKMFKPKFFRVETYFQIPGSNAPVDINNEANNWFRDMLRIFKQRKRNQKMFENFEVKYEDNAGIEQTFNLLKNRASMTIEVNSKKDLKNKEMYELIAPEFGQFIASL